MLMKSLRRHANNNIACLNVSVSGLPLFPPMIKRVYSACTSCSSVEERLSPNTPSAGLIVTSAGGRAAVLWFRVPPLWFDGVPSVRSDWAAGAPGGAGMSEPQLYDVLRGHLPARWGHLVDSVSDSFIIWLFLLFWKTCTVTDFTCN